MSVIRLSMAIAGAVGDIGDVEFAEASGPAHGDVDALRQHGEMLT